MTAFFNDKIRVSLVLSNDLFFSYHFQNIGGEAERINIRTHRARLPGRPSPSTAHLVLYACVLVSSVNGD